MKGLDFNWALRLSWLAFVFGLPTLQAAPSSVESLYSLQFQVTETFVIHSAPQKYFSIVYGNSTYGFFETKAHSLGKSRYEIQFVPPGFKLPIQFFLKRGPDTPLQAIRTVHYHSPIPKDFQQIHVQTEGRTSSNFFLLDQFLTTPDHRILGPLPFILNRIGEVVWMYMLPPTSPPGLYLVIKPLEPGIFGLLTNTRYSAFRVVDIAGKLREFVDLREILDSKAATDRPKPFVDHDFIYDADKRELLTLGTDCRFFRTDFNYLSPYMDLSQKILHFLTGLFWPRSYAVGVVFRFDLNSRSATIVWDSSQVFTFGDDFSHWGFEPDSLMTATGVQSYLDLYKNPKRAELFMGCMIEWMHANSLTETRDGGILVSLRNLNRIIELDRGFRMRWSLGLGPRNTFPLKTESEAFFGQHAPSLTRRNTILLFDNHASTWVHPNVRNASRLVEFELNPETHEAKSVWESQLEPPVFSEKRGSATELPNGNLLGFFPIDTGSRHFRIFEFDYQSRVPIASLRIETDANYPGAGYRVVPLTALGTETPVSAPSISGSRKSER